MHKNLTLFFGLFLPFLIYIVTMNDPLLEHHSFRQTQTAITTFWMTQSELRFDYLTPIFGYPWIVPAEFPIYQWIVAGLYKFIHLDLDQLGRAVSLFFFYMLVIPSYFISKDLKKNIFPLSMLLMASSPILLFFSRTFLIETTAVFFSLSATAFFLRFLILKKYGYLIGFLILGTLSLLQKITTFAPVMLIIGIFSSYLYFYDKSLTFKQLISILASLLMIFIPSLLWNIHIDTIKSTQYLTNFFTSERMALWNFGDIQQRLSPVFSLKVIVWRLVICGGVSIPLFLMIRKIIELNKKSFSYYKNINLVISKIFDKYIIFFLACAITPLFIFTNLYWIHDYYLIAVIPYFVLGIALLLANEPKITIKANSLYLFVIGINLIIFLLYYFPKIHKAPDLDLNNYKTALKLKEVTNNADVLLINGVGWNSTIPYYSQRFSIMINDWDDASIVVNNLNYFLGDKKLGAVINCFPSSEMSENGINNSKFMETFLLSIPGKIEKSGICTYKKVSKID